MDLRFVWSVELNQRVPLLSRGVLRGPLCIYSVVCFRIGMKSIGEIEEDLAEKAEPVLGFKPSSKFKRGPIGILIYVVCGIIAFFSLRSAGVF